MFSIGGTVLRYRAIARASASVRSLNPADVPTMTVLISEDASCPEGFTPVRRNRAICASVHRPMPVWTCGVMLAATLPCGPGSPAKHFASSGEKSNRRGVWHSVQCPAPPARYAPRASPSRGAVLGALGIVSVGTGIVRDRAGTDDLTGLTLFR